MQVFKSLNSNPNLSLALGYFDGVHLAHQKLISTAVEYAKNTNTKSAVITFEKNPANCFNDKKTLNITSNSEKLEKFEALGVNYVYMLDFEQFRNMDALEYLEDVIIKNFKPNCIVSGFNHHFGAKKSGSSKLLANYAKHFNYEFIEFPEQRKKDITISSTEIRELLSQGKVDKANSLLGHKFNVTNNVIEGKQIASKLGFPTANLLWAEDIVKLPYGVYFGYVYMDKIFPAVINWGVKPTFDSSNHELLEVHILNFNSQIYGKIINVAFVEKIRDEFEFPNIEELKKQIQKDVDYVKKRTYLS